MPVADLPAILGGAKEGKWGAAAGPHARHRRTITDPHDIVSGAEAPRAPTGD
jgi:hypothetical protein